MLGLFQCINNRLQWWAFGLVFMATDPVSYGRTYDISTTLLRAQMEAKIGSVSLQMEAIAKKRVQKKETVFEEIRTWYNG